MLQSRVTEQLLAGGKIVLIYAGRQVGKTTLVHHHVKSKSHNGVHFSLGANSPFDKLRANGQAFSFALSLSKGSFPPI
jgi:predicted AAA+ superfamily ATPase